MLTTKTDARNLSARDPRKGARAIVQASVPKWVDHALNAEATRRGCTPAMLAECILIAVLTRNERTNDNLCAAVLDN